MPAAKLPLNEKERLKALEEYSILDTPSEKDFNDLSLLASKICGTPISLVSLVDEKRQWFKSKQGLEAQETPREYAFCAHALLEPEKIMVVENSLEDPRFSDNPIALGSPNVVFYAGAPLVTPEGHALGTLCVIDNKPKKLNQEQKDALRALANQVMGQMELRKRNRILQETAKSLEKANEELKTFAYTISHDIKAPIKGITTIAAWMESEYKDKLDERGQKYIELIHYRADHLDKLVEGIIEYSRTDKQTAGKFEEINLRKIVEDVLKLISVPFQIELKFDFQTDIVYTHRMALFQILQNLLSNAVKYSNEKAGEISISTYESSGYVMIEIGDNGPGIDSNDHQYIFQLFQTLGNKDRYGKKGTGVGLSIVKKLIDELGGLIEVTNRKPSGTNFIIKFPIQFK